MDVVNLEDKFSLIQEHWKPKIAGQVNDAYVKLVKFKGEFLWHKHDAEDELFLVVKGNLTIKLRDRDLRIAAGEFAIIPRGVEHMPVADEEVHVMLIEPKATLNTGDRQTNRTLPELERI
jgi:mannose-6-phosphate isomerase-like protein (cupin superfamily)